jgi:hypothetical protein
MSQTCGAIYQEVKGKKNVIEVYALAKFILVAQKNGLNAEQIVDAIHGFCQCQMASDAPDCVIHLVEGTHTVRSMDLMAWRDLGDELWNKE